MAGNLNVASRVHFLNNVDTNEEKFQYLNVASIYVLSSLHEGFGIVLQEAMQVGLPVVATNNGGQVDLIKDNVNGLLVSPKDSNQLKTVILKLFNNEDVMDRMKKNNIEKIKEFDSEKISQKYLALVKE
jgi:glycosyltransferase involved in cell wall biosynthesis